MGVFLGAPSVMWGGLSRASGPKTVTRLGRLEMPGMHELVSKLGGEFRGDKVRTERLGEQSHRERLQAKGELGQQGRAQSRGREDMPPSPTSPIGVNESGFPECWLESRDFGGPYAAGGPDPP